MGYRPEFTLMRSKFQNHCVKRGVATEAMTALCHLADKYQFKLEGGPIGWSETLRRDEFVEWVLSFGFQPDPSPLLPKVDDPTAFYVCRQPKRG